MENPATPRFTLNLGGQDLPLRFEYRDFANAERVLGLPILTRFSELSETPTYLVSLLLFIGIQAAYNENTADRRLQLRARKQTPSVLSAIEAIKDLTLDTSSAFINFENAAEIERVVGEAVKAAFPEPKEDPEAEKGDPLAPMDSGTTIGPSESSTSDSPVETSGV
jgi:hypothetical protein